MATDNENNKKKPFRAIIVGGGLAGLTAAHIFTKAGIDFVILEKHDDCQPTIGSLLGFWPQTYRVMSQLGLLPVLQPVLDTAYNNVYFDAMTSKINYTEPADLWIKYHGFPVTVVHRPDLVNALYNSLPADAQARILCRKRVQDIAVNPDGVSVTCADGTVEQGSIIIGADGVRSRVRHCMQTLAAASEKKKTASPSPSEDQDREEPRTTASPFKSTYRMFFANAPVLPGLEPNTRYDGPHDGMSTACLMGRDRGWLLGYEKLEGPTPRLTPQYHRYTEADKAAMISRFRDLHMAPGWKVGDALSLALGPVGMLDIEEGVVEHWYLGGSVVLVGDAAQKLAPQIGLGYNLAVSELVVLVNGLRRLLLEQSRDGDDDNNDVAQQPSTEELEQVFKSYQEECMVGMDTCVELSEQGARIGAWIDWKSKVIAKYLAPYFPIADWAGRYVMGPLIARAPVLDWLDENEVLPPGVIPWEKFPDTEQGLEMAEKSRVAKSAAAANGLFSSRSLLTVAVVFGGLAVGLQYFRKLS